MNSNDPRRPDIGFCISVRDDVVTYGRILAPDPEVLGCIDPHVSAGATIPPLPVRELPVDGAVSCEGAEVVRELHRAYRRRERAPWVPLAGVFLIWIAIVAAVLAGGGAAGVAVAIVGGFIVSWIGYRIVRRMDAAAGASLLVYQLDEPAARRFAILQGAAQRLASSGRVWHVASEGRLLDARQKLGARRFLRRSRIRPGLSTPTRTLTNLAVPTIYGESRKYFFLPDRVLVYDARGVRPLAYERFSARTSEVLVVEDEDVPADARVVETTWLHPDRDGGPDPAVHNNRRCPIVLYGSLELVGSSGTPELFHGSVPAALEAFAAALDAMASGEDADISDEPEESRAANTEPSAEPELDDEIADAVLRFIVGGGIGDVDSIGRRFGLTFASAARMLCVLEEDGFLGPSRKDGSHAVRRSAVRYVELLDREASSVAGTPRRPTRTATLRRRRGRPLEPHEILGVPAAASDAEIAEAYRDLARMYHPDKVATLAPEFQDLAELRMKEINAAYATLLGATPAARRAGGR